MPPKQTNDSSTVQDKNNSNIKMSNDQEIDLDDVVFDGSESYGHNSDSDKDNSGDDAPFSKHLGREIPIVELQIEHATYAPVTSKANGGGRNGADKQGRGGMERTRTVVLDDVSTCIAPGKLTAWMGPSGSGKTSLISVAAGLTRKGDLSSSTVIRVNGERGRIPKRLVGVVWQDDLLLSNLTVEENIYFAARLKTPESTSNADVRNLVYETMKDLGLLHVRNSLVGSPVAHVRGVSGGERKRVAVASELVVRPSLLFLDEPTSGLDATTAQGLIETLKQLATVGGHSIAVVIHQPRTAIYNQFDHLLLLSKGRTIYDGPPQQARAYLESCPTVHPLPPETGIADWLMDVVTNDERRKITGSKKKDHDDDCDVTAADDEEQGKGTAGILPGPVLAQHWLDAQARCDENDPNADNCNGSYARRRGIERKLSNRMSTLKELNAAPKYYVGFWTQFKLLTKRSMKQNRGERLTMSALILQCIYLFFTALFWWRMPDNTSWIFNRNSLFFFILIAQSNGIVIASVTIFQRERTLLLRERAKKLYGVAPYFLGKILSDISNNVLLPVAYGAIVYWTANYRETAVAYLQFLLALYMTFLAAQSMGLFLSIAIPSPQLSLVLAPPITLFFMIVGGFYIPFSKMHPAYKWLSWLSFARYGYSALVINEFADRMIPCDPTNSESYSVGSSDQCPFPGNDVISGIGITGIAGNYWFNIGMVVALQLVFRVLAYWLLRRVKAA